MLKYRKNAHSMNNVHLIESGIVTQKAYENHQVLSLSMEGALFNGLVNWMLEDFFLDWIYSRRWRQS